MISVGIDIGTSSVKLVEIQTTSKSYTIARYQDFPLSNDPMKDKKIEVLDIFRQIAGAYDPDSTRIVLAVPQQHAVIRYRQFPFRERFKILRSIAFELEDDIPFSQDDAIFDAKLTRYVENAADVIACAVPNTYIKEILDLAREAGLEPEILTIDGLALANPLERWFDAPPVKPALPPTPEAQSAEILVDIGHSRTLVVLHSEGCLIHARNIDWGGKHVAEAIASKYGLHYLEALKELQKKAFILLANEGATRDQIIFSDVIKQALEPMAQDIQFTLLEFTTSRNLRFNKAQICGGVSQIKNLGAFLTQKWELPVNRFHHFELHPSTNIEVSSHVEAVSPLAIGIAIEGLRRPRNPPVNLLKGDFAQQGETLKMFIEKWGYATQLAAVAFACLFVYGILRDNFATSMAEQALTVLKTQAAAIADIKGRQATPAAIRRFVKLKKEEISARKTAVQVKQLNSALDIVSSIHKVAPPSDQMLVELRKVSVENEFVEVQGEVAVPAAIARFRQALTGLALDGRVDPVSPGITAGPGKQAFGFRLKVDRRRGS